MNLLEHLNTPLAVQLIETFAHFLWQGAVILAVAELLGLLLRKASSRTRYALFLGSFLLMALAPVATFIWLNPVTPNFEVAPITESVQPMATTIKPVTMTEETLPAAPPTWRDYCPHLAMLYLTGVFLLICRVAFAFGGGWKLRRNATPATDPVLLAKLNELTDRIRLAKAPALAYCKRVATPTVVGILRPTILFPFFMMNGLTPNQVEMILLHELAHIKRFDPWVNLFQRLIEALLFFHPAVWWLSHRVRIEREKCCDDHVVSMGAERFSYAKTLVEAAALRNESQLSPHPSGVHLTDSKNHLRSRILRLIEGPTPEKTNLPRAWILGAAVVVFLSVASWMQVDAAEDLEEKEKSEEMTFETFRVDKEYGEELAEILTLRVLNETQTSGIRDDQSPRVTYDTTTGSLIVLGTSDVMELTKRLLNDPSFMEKVASGNLIAETYRVAPDKDMDDSDPDAKLRRRKHVNFTKQVFQTLFYGVQSIEEAAAEHRVMVPHLEEGTISVVDTPANHRKAREYLSGRNEDKPAVEPEGKPVLKARKFIVVPQELLEKEDRESINKRRDLVQETADSLSDLLYGGHEMKDKEKAAVEGRVMYPDLDEGTIDIVDTPENLSKVSDHLTRIDSIKTSGVRVKHIKLDTLAEELKGKVAFVAETGPFPPNLSTLLSEGKVTSGTPSNERINVGVILDATTQAALVSGFNLDEIEKAVTLIQRLDIESMPGNRSGKATAVVTDRDSTEINLETREFTVVPDELIGKIDLASIKQRRKQVGEVLKYLQEIVYGSGDSEMLKKIEEQGRTMAADSEDGTVIVTDTDENIRKVEEHLATLFPTGTESGTGKGQGLDTLVEDLNVQGDRLIKILELLASFSDTRFTNKAGTVVLDSVHVILQDKTVKEILETLEKLYPIRFEFKDNHRFTAYPKTAATAEPTRRGDKKDFDTVVETLKVNGDSLWQLLELLATYSETGLSIHPEVDRKIKVHLKRDNKTVREIYQELGKAYPIRFEYTDESNVLVLPTDESKTGESNFAAGSEEQSNPDSHPGFNTLVEDLNVQGDNLRDILELLATYSETEITVDPKIPQSNLILDEEGKTVREILKVIEEKLPIRIEYIDETHAVVHPKEEDTPPAGKVEAQIEVEVRVVEIALRDRTRQELDEWIRPFIEEMQEGKNPDSFVVGANPEGTSIVPVGRIEFENMLSMISRNADVRILSMPKITVINGEAGRIRIGHEFPVVQESKVPGTGEPEIAYEELGVGVEILPILLDSGEIDLALDIEHKTIDQDFQPKDADGKLLPGPPIDTQGRSVKVRTEDGETILVKPLWQGEPGDPDNPTEVWGLVTTRTVGDE